MQTGKSPLTHVKCGWIINYIPIVAFTYSLLIVPLSNVNLQPSEQSELIGSVVADGNLVNRLFWIFLTIVTIVCTVRRVRLPRLSGAFLFLSIYIFVSIVSISWSAVAGITSRRVVLQICVILCIGLPMLSGVSPARVINQLAILFAFICTLSVIFIPIAGIPDFGYNGFYGQKNILGQVAVISVAIFFWKVWFFRNKKIFYYTFLIASLLILYTTKSKTSQGLLILLTVVTVVQTQILRFDRPLRVISYSLIFAFITTALIFCHTFDVSVSDFSLFLFGDTTFTGRTAIWEFAMQHIANNPILGHGYGAFWGVGEQSAAIREDAGFISGLLQAHNGYVDILLELGWLGMALAVVMIAGLGIEIGTACRLNIRYASLFLFIYLFALANNLMESSLFRGDSILWLLLLFQIFTFAGQAPLRTDEK